MALFRLQLDLAIPKEIFDRIPPAKIEVIKQVIRELASLAVTVNPGKPDKEPVKATYHICYHDEAVPKPCGPEVEI